MKGEFNAGRSIKIVEAPSLSEWHDTDSLFMRIKMRQTFDGFLKRGAFYGYLSVDLIRAKEKHSFGVSVASEGV